MIAAILTLTVILGWFSTAMASYLAWYFYKIDHRISNALMVMVMAESIASLCTLVFAISALVEFCFPSSDASVLSEFILSLEGSTIMRWLIFLPVVLSSIHLYVVIRRIIDED